MITNQTVNVCLSERLVSAGKDSGSYTLVSTIISQLHHAGVFLVSFLDVNVAPY